MRRQSFEPRLAGTKGCSAAKQEKEIAPVIANFWERAEFPHHLIPRLATLGLGGGTLKGYGCPGQSVLGAAMGVIETARVDGSISTFFLVHNALAALTIGARRAPARLLVQKWLKASSSGGARGSSGCARRSAPPTHDGTVAGSPVNFVSKLFDTVFSDSEIGKARLCEAAGGLARGCMAMA